MVHEEVEKQRRATQQSILVAREALAATRPIVKKIGAWQTKAAYFRALAAHVRQKGHAAPPTVQVEAEQLLSAIRSERQQFYQSCAALPRRVLSSSRFTDVTRGLETAEQAMHQAAVDLNTNTSA